MMAYHRTFAILAAAVIAAVVGQGQGCRTRPAPFQWTTSTLIIDWPAHLGELERPPAVFDHLLHTRTLQAEGCAVCHTGEKGTGRAPAQLPDCSKAASCRDGWHGFCVGCHTGRKAGPTADCGFCHRRVESQPPVRVKMAFDYLLHRRHIDSLEKEAAGKRSCGRCHHAEKAGQEVACCDCHGRDKNILDWRGSAHAACIGCHRLRAEKAAVTGPIDCQGCHGADRPKAAEPPVASLAQPGPTADWARLERGQPDRMWIKSAASKTAAVPFTHRKHEARASFCTFCHHQAMGPCSACHPAGGGKEKVSLYWAHHDQESGRSCLGCHRQQLRKPPCAGCHRQMDTADRQPRCAGCHRGPEEKSATAAPGEELFRPPLLELALLDEKDFPTFLVLDTGGGEFAPTRFAHRRIVEALFAATAIGAGAHLARAFHSPAQVLCAACHHRQPLGEQPISCGSCHDPAGRPTSDRPGLREAYHRQCIACHQAMDLKQGCRDCHAPMPAKEASP